MLVAWGDRLKRAYDEFDREEIIQVNNGAEDLHDELAYSGLRKYWR